MDLSVRAILVKMRESLERLLAESIDYAGIFPPAQLSMSEAVDRYVAARSGPERRLVSRFACSTARLSELLGELKRRPGTPSFPVAAIGRPSTDQESWEATLVHDAEAMNRFQEMAGERAEIEAYEVRIPGHAEIEAYVRDLAGFRDAEVYLELPLSDGLADSLAFLAETEWVGAKVRSGGLEASAFPDAWNLAGFVRQCVDLELPFKMTAGLHHALPHRDEATEGAAHGFVNVLASAALILSEDLSQRELERLLLDPTPASWTFDDQALAWKGHRASLAHIEEARTLFVSFGSCSIDDPIGDLAALWT